MGSDLNVISSIPSLYNFQREGISHDSLLKRYAILFDQIIFNRFGVPIGSGGVAETLAEYISILISSGNDWNDRRKLGRTRSFQKLFVDCWDRVPNAQEFESMRFQVLPDDARARLSQFCYREIRRLNELPDDSYDFDIDDVKELSGDLYSDIGLNILAVAEGLNVIPSYSPIIGRALANE